MRGLRRLAAAVALALAGLPAAPALAQEGFQPRCTVATIDDAPHAVCETGPVAAGRVLHVRYQKEGTTGSAEANFVAFAASGKAAAVLGAVDRGDRRRQRVVGLAAADLARLLDAARGAGPANRVGLAQIFDRLDVLAPIGASRDEIGRAASVIRADGPIGDAGRAALDAIRQLALASQASRHVLVVASDGKPEDRGYGRDDVARAARDAKVNVVTIAHRERPDAVGPEVASLRRLAEETGGLFLEAGGPTGRLDEAAVARFAQYLGSGGTATFPLKRSDPRGRYVLSLELDGGRTATASFFAEVAAQGPRAGQGAASGPSTAADAPAGQGGAAPGSDTAFMERSGLDNLFDWITGEWETRPAAVVAVPALLVLAVAALLWVQARERRRRTVFAWLEIADTGGSRVAITTTDVRIGRHADNDVRFSDKSVHRHHAVMHRDAATARFVITDVSRDLPRSNGVMVNGEPIDRAALGSGDTVELGEVSFRFFTP